MASIDGTGPTLAQRQETSTTNAGLRSNVLAQDLPDAAPSVTATISKKAFVERLTNLAETVNDQLIQVGLKPVITVVKDKEAETLIQVLRALQSHSSQLQRIDPEGMGQTLATATEIMSMLPSEVVNQANIVLHNGRLRFGNSRDKAAYTFEMEKLQSFIDKMN